MYPVKPYVLKADCELNRIYRDTDGCTCVTYILPHGGTRTTKYVKGEQINIIYDTANPEKHLIIDDKDKINSTKGFMTVTLIFAVAAGMAAVLGLIL